MTRPFARFFRPALWAASMLALLAASSDVLAHCDTMDGPVVTDAKRALRTGEGAPYTGLLPEGAPVEPAIRLADQALATGDVSTLVTAISAHASEGIRQRFARAAEAKARADESPANGRAFVEAYVEFTHYVERLHRDTTTNAAHGTGDKASSAHDH